ncbi:pantoate--beta-alanine ligase [Aquibacillus sp. 3ASR75-11]|uniref:Pantothenate synthetase n=1 Tax=Terrihalobacillus insolitus TaxID=2950438 RepID=A0A9X3WWN4_9BACI|nr:pantoate--beta-alanine ligase [Terrihalobacillus insolitus]MDC3413027.1 pantoate--beta-alanine ligase [Terrihalobacillus insolitus]MDC3424769.1 pantoate--beta-alanine ligase [Terrihalobacillus insolitus]
MKVIRTIQEMQQYAQAIKQERKSIGFVPTMGYLHEGHESLMMEARKNNDIVIMSIFVNPLQFGPNEDYDRYPRDEARDQKIAEQNQVDVLFIPSVDDMYPQEQTIQMKVIRRVNVMCGKSREGHFDGVATVLTKLFHLTYPNRVYFGMKDAQQVAVTAALITDLNFPIELIPVPTVREQDGLAKSSRNVHLSKSERSEAKYLYQALLKGQKLVVDGEKNPANIVKEVKNMIDHHINGKLDYVELLQFPSLEPLSTIDQQVILAAAVYFNNARLIDNLVFNKDGMLTSRI